MQRIKTLKYKGRRHLPLPTGPYTVGCCDVMTSKLKFGVFVRLYYPAKGQGALERYLQWPQWIPHKEYINGYAAWIRLPPYFYRLLHHIRIGNLYVPAVWQAELQPAGEKYPVIVFSHGLNGWRSAYSTICLELASYGIVVAALEHRDHSASASFYTKQVRMSASGPNPGAGLAFGPFTFPVGCEPEESDLHRQEVGPFCHTKEWMTYQRVSKDNELPLRTRQVRCRAKECSETLDLMEDLNYGRFVANAVETAFNAGMFKNQLDLSKSFVMGHSLGGATSILSLATDHRFRGGVLLDPLMFSFLQEEDNFSISQPLLCLIIKGFQTKESMKILRRLRSLHQSGKFFIMRKAHRRDLCDAPFAPRVALPISSLSGRRIARFSALDLATDLVLQFLGEYTGGCSRPCSLKLQKLREKYIKEQE